MKLFTFDIRITPGCAVAVMRTPRGAVREKLFRNGYASARVTAQKWIDEQIAIIRECEQVDGLRESRVVELHKE